MTMPPARIETPPEPFSYVKMLQRCINVMPPPKIAARPALVPLVQAARDLLSSANPDSDACLALYEQIMKVPPAGS